MASRQRHKRCASCCASPCRTIKGSSVSNFGDASFDNGWNLDDVTLNASPKYFTCSTDGGTITSQDSSGTPFVTVDLTLGEFNSSSPPHGAVLRLTLNGGAQVITWTQDDEPNSSFGHCTIVNDGVTVYDKDVNIGAPPSGGFTHPSNQTSRRFHVCIEDGWITVGLKMTAAGCDRYEAAGVVQMVGFADCEIPSDTGPMVLEFVDLKGGTVIVDEIFFCERGTDPEEGATDPGPCERCFRECNRCAGRKLLVKWIVTPTNIVDVNDGSFVGKFAELNNVTFDLPWGPLLDFGGSQGFNSGTPLADHNLGACMGWVQTTVSHRTVGQPPVDVWIMVHIVANLLTAFVTRTDPRTQAQSRANSGGFNGVLFWTKSLTASGPSTPFQKYECDIGETTINLTGGASITLEPVFAS